MLTLSSVRLRKLGRLVVDLRKSFSVVVCTLPGMLSLDTPRPGNGVVPITSTVGVCICVVSGWAANACDNAIATGAASSIAAQRAWFFFMTPSGPIFAPAPPVTGTPGRRELRKANNDYMADLGKNSR